jgi:hypothetical protein
MKIFGISRHDRTHYQLLPVSFEASCNRFTGEEEEAKLRRFMDIWKPFHAQYGPIVRFNSDADSRRDKAFDALISAVWDMDGALKLFGGTVTVFDCTTSRDRRHIDKRIRGSSEGPV